VQSNVGKTDLNAITVFFFFKHNPQRYTVRQ